MAGLEFEMTYHLRVHIDSPSRLGQKEPASDTDPCSLSTGKAGRPSTFGC